MQTKSDHVAKNVGRSPTTLSSKYFPKKLFDRPVGVVALKSETFIHAHKQFYCASWKTEMGPYMLKMR